ncbi:hypothetical protein B0J18DRAFT_255595 [Chaetomium sp. MPI-SDFR-AT-0129]|nr:hypothetical protein B0J18DRAFT_255595 [Chaetomium sp. MPI-SDFR-AT-0129]
MPITASVPVGSPPHDVPRRVGPLTNTTLFPTTQTAHACEEGAENVEASDGSGHGKTMGYAFDDADENQGLQDELGEEEGGKEEGEEVEDRESREDEEDERDEEGGYDDDGDSDKIDYDSEGGAFHYTEHHNCPIQYSVLSDVSYSHFYQEPEGVFPDGLDASDDPDADADTGVSLNDYPFPQPIANDVVMEDPADSDSDDQPTWVENTGSDSESALDPEPDTTAAAQAVAFVMGTMPFASTTAFAGVTWEQSPPGGAWTHTFSISNPNPSTIGPSNYGLVDFLRHWARQSRLLQTMSRGSCPWPNEVNALQSLPEASIKYADLEGDQCDLQGIAWDSLGVTRRDARERRLLTYNNYVNVAGSDMWTPDLSDVALPSRDNFFRFQRMNIKKNIHLAHFQLRNVFASTSRSRVFYPAVGAIQQFNPISGHSRAVMKLSDAPASQISTLAAGHGVLVAGGFGGEYLLRHLDPNDPENASGHEGVITNSISGITNHVSVYQSRTSFAPLAAFASNDNCFRVLDLTTETWLSEETHEFAPNCAAVSPDGRLRVMVGDSTDVVITAAESSRPGGEPDVLHKLSGHRDFGFACDWADDGWTIATAFQDKTVKIWDARRLTDTSGNSTSVCTIRSEMAGARSLRFSPIGSGKRVLVAAEEADFINIIDARTFRSKQTIDIFGELGGVSFTNGGHDLMVLCCDRARGGVLELERCGQGDRFTWDSDEEVPAGRKSHHRRRGEPTSDWPRSIFTEDRRRLGRSRRMRLGSMASQVELDPF